MSRSFLPSVPPGSVPERPEQGASMPQELNPALAEGRSRRRTLLAHASPALERTAARGRHERRKCTIFSGALYRLVGRVPVAQGTAVKFPRPGRSVFSLPVWYRGPVPFPYKKTPVMLQSGCYNATSEKEPVHFPKCQRTKASNAFVMRSAGMDVLLCTAA